VGLLMSSVQLLPTWELVRHSVRAGGVSSAFAAEQSMPPWGFITYLLPDFFGYAIPEKNTDYWLFDVYYWDMVPYIGILPLLLLTIPLFHKAPGPCRMFYLLLACSLLLMLGPHFPLFGLMQKIPPFYYFRAPARFSLLASFSIALLSGYGLHLLLSQAREGKERILKGLERISGGLFCLLLAGTLLLHGVLTWFQAPIKERLLRVGDAYVREHIHGKGLFFKPLDYYLDKLTWAVDVIVERLRHALNPANPRVAVALGCVAASVLLVALLRRGRLRPAGFLTGCTLLLVSDLFLFGLRYNATMPVEQALAPSPEGIRLLQDTDRFRVFRDVRVPEGEALLEKRLLPVSMGGLWGIASADEFTPLKMNRHAELLDLVKRDREYVLNGTFSRPNLLSLMGVRYVLALKPVTNLPREAPLGDGRVLLYRNDRALPPVFFVTDWIQVSSRDELRRVMTDPGTDFSRVAVLEEAPPFPRDPGSDGESQVVVREISPDMDRVEVLVENPRPGTLVYGCTHYPGWTARVDGEPRPLVRVNSIYQGVFLPPGEHEVVMEFHPVHMKAGAILSLLSLLGWAAVLIPLRFKGPAPKREDSPSPACLVGRHSRERG